MKIEFNFVQYAPNDEVTLWVNKVGPYHNPQETYMYFSLPYCIPQNNKELRTKWDGLGSLLEGNDLYDSGLHVKFKQNVNEKFCDITLNDERAEDFAYAVENHYWFQLYLDDLPIWGMVLRQFDFVSIVRLAK